MTATTMLAIETSQRQGEVALQVGDGAIEVEALQMERGHDDDLMPAIARLAARVNVTPQSIDAVCVSIGPGGFTGIRLAVVTAKMLALSIGATIVAVPSAEIVAHGTPDLGSGPIMVALATKRESFWSTVLHRHEDDWVVVGTPCLATIDALPSSDVRAIVADNHAPESLRAWATSSDVPVHAPVFTARAALVLGRQRLGAGLTTNAASLEPLYPRPPEAVTLWEQRHQTP
ncbi:MAG: tRNA (adenosine(37)-N6)-threonylcarbamoyltransferase complex dimerization subunit type 1 TsaB [Planctomycetota bacterium]